MTLLPEAKAFLEQFQEQSRILVESSDLLLARVRLGAERSGSTPVRIEKLEREADEIVHAIANQLNRTFITPCGGRLIAAKMSPTCCETL